MSVNFDFNRKNSIKTSITNKLAVVFFFTTAISFIVYSIVFKTAIVKELDSLGINYSDIFDKISGKLILSAIVIGLISMAISILVTYKFLHPLAHLLNNFRIHFEMLAEGDYFYRIKSKHFARKDELGPIAQAADSMQVKVMTIVEEMVENSNSLTDESQTLTSFSEDLRDLTEKISKLVSNITNSINDEKDDVLSVVSEFGEFKGQLSDNISNVNEISAMINKIDTKATNSYTEMDSLNLSFNELNNKFGQFLDVITEMKNDIKKVTEITEIINQIAEQTNLLALNAAIEAARAGEAGKGFSVVSNEIRNLSIQTKESSVNITNLIGSVLSSSNELFNKTSILSETINNQKAIINNSISAFNDISDSVGKVSPKVQKLQDSSNKIVRGNDKIISKITSVSSSSETISSLADDINSSTDTLKKSSQVVLNSAKNLKKLSAISLDTTSKFKLTDKDGIKNRNENK